MDALYVPGTQQEMIAQRAMHSMLSPLNRALQPTFLSPRHFNIDDSHLRFAKQFTTPTVF